MLNGKKKAVTFSFDDGVTQDRRFIDLLNKYGLKGTFNLNSGLLGRPGELIREGVRVSHDKISPEEVASLYRGHEVAAHTLTHPNLTDVQDPREIVRQVEEDRKALSALVGYPVRGFAYPGGGVNANEQIAALLRAETGVRYGRTTVTTGAFAPEPDLFLFRPTAALRDFDALTALAERFFASEPETPAVFYLWGHTYEYDIRDDWDRLEDFLRFISGKADVFYGTNAEILLGDANG